MRKRRNASRARRRAARDQRLSTGLPLRSRLTRRSSGSHSWLRSLRCSASRSSSPKRSRSETGRPTRASPPGLPGTRACAQEAELRTRRHAGELCGTRCLLRRRDGSTEGQQGRTRTPEPTRDHFGSTAGSGQHSIAAAGRLRPLLILRSLVRVQPGPSHPRRPENHSRGIREDTKTARVRRIPRSPS